MPNYGANEIRTFFFKKHGFKKSHNFTPIQQEILGRFQSQFLPDLPSTFATANSIGFQNLCHGNCCCHWHVQKQTVLNENNNVDFFLYVILQQKQATPPGAKTKCACLWICYRFTKHFLSGTLLFELFRGAKRQSSVSKNIFVLKIYIYKIYVHDNFSQEVYNFRMHGSNYGKDGSTRYFFELKYLARYSGSFGHSVRSSRKKNKRKYRSWQCC